MSVGEWPCYPQKDSRARRARQAFKVQRRVPKEEQGKR